MNLYPYNTTAGRLFKVDGIQKDLKKAMAMGQDIHYLRSCPYDTRSNASEPVAMVGPGSTVGVFKHPVFVELPQHEEGGILFIDGRGFTRTDRANDGFKITNQSEYTLEAGRAFLTLVGRNQGASSLLNFSELPTRVFSQWLSARVNSQLHLSIEEQVSLKALAAWFHICQYYEEDVFQGEDQKRAKARAMRCAGMDGKLWDESVGSGPLSWAGTLDSFCKLVRERGGDSVRLEGFKRQFITEVTIATFRGAPTRELVAVALEHPPSFIAMIERCVAEHSFYKRMPLGEVVERNLRNRSERDDFLSMLSRLPY